MRVANAENLIQAYIAQYNMPNFLNENLLTHLELFRFPAYAHVMREEDEQHYFYFLVEGQVQCNHYHLNGKLAVIAISKPFTAIGDFEIFGEEKVRTNVIAVQDVVMLGIRRELVEYYGADDPRFLRFLIEQLRHKLYQSNAIQMSQGLSVIQRVAIHLLAQTNHNEIAIVLPEKEILASLLGTTQRHLNRVFKQLIDEDIISVNYPDVHILNRIALEDMASQ